MLDRTRTIAERRLGVDPVDPNTSFEEGALLHWSSNGWKVSDDADGTVIRGIAGINKQSSVNGVVIKESITFGDDDTATLNHANLVEGSEMVTSTDESTTYTIKTDYTMNYTNGIVTRVDGGHIEAGATVLISYSYQRTLQEIEEDIGMPITNSLDETFGSNKVVVFQGRCRIATTCYDTSKAYAVNDALYDNGDGLLTSDSTGSKVQVGRVLKVPEASDPYLIADLSL